MAAGRRGMKPDHTSRALKPQVVQPAEQRPVPEQPPIVEASCLDLHFRELLSSAGATRTVVPRANLKANTQSTVHNAHTLSLKCDKRIKAESGST